MYSMDMAKAEVKHIFNRFGFGLSPEEYRDFASFDRRDALEFLLRDSREISPLPKLDYMEGKPGAMFAAFSEERLSALKRSNEHIRMLGLAWFDRMVSGSGQLRERMTLFWHDHFASTSVIDLLVVQQHESIRQHALGSFRDLLHAMCQDPMLLDYLNNGQNRKRSPNENFARELLELFSLGEGHYTEMDVQEAARAFTGHGVDLNGQYKFRRGIHDYGWKTFLGEEGQFDAHEVVDIILAQPQTAVFVTRKILRYFVCEDISEELVASTAERFYESDYDLESLISEIILADWFYETPHVGTKIKSPVDILAGLFKHCRIRLKDEHILVQLLRVMGQLPFNPPNVAGWPIGKQWIDGTGLLLRMRIPDYLMLGNAIEVRPKASFDMQTYFREEIESSGKFVDFDLDGLRSIAGQGDRLEQIRNLSDYLLASPVNLEHEDLRQWILTDHNISELVLFNLFRLPEYQLS